MTKYIIFTALLVLLTTICKAQTFSYSDNHINNPYDINIIGQVKDNIIIWCENSKNYNMSAILIYDKHLSLIRKQTTDILHSDINPSVRFYHNADSFYVAYQYKKENKWEYKIAVYNSKGNLSSAYTIDSLCDFNTDDKLYYNLCQSADKKVLCCIKTILSKNYNALRFEFTYLNQSNLYRDSLFLSFDTTHEKLVDFLVDNNKNITLLKTTNTDTGFCISIIKKEFAADHFLTATKKLAAGDLRNSTCQLFDKQKHYTITGVWESALYNSSNKNSGYKTGLYSWRLTDTLTDMPGDTILCNDSTIISQFQHYADYLPNSTEDFFGIQTDSVPIRDIKDSSNNGYFHWQGDSKTGYYAFIHNSRAQPSQETISHYRADFSIASFNQQNRPLWRTVLKRNTDDMMLTDLWNNKIVAGKKGIHIVRSITAKNKKNTIEHIIINYSGGYEKINTALWNNKYTYLVQNAVETNDGSLIITCLKGTRLFFARMTLE